MHQRTIVIFFVFVVFLASCSSTSHKRSLGEVVDDTVIASKLRVKLIKDETVPAKNIRIKVVRGVVSLEGEVSNQDQINQAIEIAEKQNGVREVKAYLVLKEFGELRQEPVKKNAGLSLFKRRGGAQKSSNTLEEKDLDSDVAQTLEDGSSQPTTAVAQPSPLPQPTETGSVTQAGVPADDFKEFE